MDNSNRVSEQAQILFYFKFFLIFKFLPIYAILSPQKPNMNLHKGFLMKKIAQFCQIQKK